MTSSASAAWANSLLASNPAGSAKQRKKALRAALGSDTALLRPRIQALVERALLVSDTGADAAAADAAASIAPAAAHLAILKGAMAAARSVVTEIQMGRVAGEIAPPSPALMDFVRARALPATLKHLPESAASLLHAFGMATDADARKQIIGDMQRRIRPGDAEGEENTLKALMVARDAEAVAVLVQGFAGLRGTLDATACMRVVRSLVTHGHGDAAVRFASGKDFAEGVDTTMLRTGLVHLLGRGPHPDPSKASKLLTRFRLDAGSADFTYIHDACDRRSMRWMIRTKNRDLLRAFLDEMPKEKGYTAEAAELWLKMHDEVCPIMEAGAAEDALAAVFTAEGRWRRPPPTTSSASEGGAYLALPAGFPVYMVDTLPRLLSAVDQLVAATAVGMDCEWRAFFRAASAGAGAGADAAGGGARKKAKKGSSQADLLQLSTPSAAFLVDIPALAASDAAQACDDALCRVFKPARGDGGALRTIFVFGRDDMSALRRGWPGAKAFTSSGPASPSPRVAVVDLAPSKAQLHAWQAASRAEQQRGQGEPGKAGSIAPRQAAVASGLSTVAELLLGRGLDKSCQLSDWKRRPLSSRQVMYAALDAWVLVAIDGKIKGMGGAGEGAGR